MNEKELITSGKLELFVSGVLPTNEMDEIAGLVATSEALRKEVEAIEQTMMQLSSEASRDISPDLWRNIVALIGSENGKNAGSIKRNWIAIVGWAAVIVAMLMVYNLNQKVNSLEDDLNETTVENQELQNKVLNTREELHELNSLLTDLGSPDFKSFNLPSNTDVIEGAFAKVYYNIESETAFIDARGLPQAPPGKVYQAWSLQLSPLTPASMGILTDENKVVEGIYKFEGFPSAEAFGITLEPAGGSETPTLEQLYTLGTISP